MSEMGAKADVVVEADLIRAVVTPLANPLEGVAVLLHKKWSPAPDIGGPNSIVISDWNDRHQFGGGTPGFALLRDASAPDGVKWSSLPLAKLLLAEAHADLPQGQVFTTGPGLSYSLGSLTLAVGGISNEMLRDSAGRSVIGRSGTAGDPEDIIATFDSTVLRRVGGVLGFGALDLGDTSMFTGVLPASKMDPAFPATVPDNGITDLKLRDSLGLSVIGRAVTGTGDPADIVAGADGQALRRSGTTLAFGALDLANASAFTGVLPAGSGGVPGGGTDGQVLTKVSGNPAWAAPTGGGSGSGLPAGGATGDLLIKTSPVDGAAGWGLTLPNDLRLLNEIALRGRTSGAVDRLMIRMGSDDNIYLGDGVVATIIAHTPTFVAQGNAIVHGTTGLTLTAGKITLPNAKVVAGKNAAATVDVPLIGLDSSDQLVLSDGGHNIVTSAPEFRTAGQLFLANSMGIFMKTLAGVDTLALSRNAANQLVLGSNTQDIVLWAPNVGVTGALNVTGAMSLGTPLAAAYGGLTPGGTVGQVLTKNSSTDRDASWATPSTTVADNAITNAKLRDSVGVSVIGRSVNSTGDPADIAATLDGQVLRRAAGVLGFGAVDLADTDAVTNTLPVTNGGTGGATAADARTSLDVYSKGEVDALAGGGGTSGGEQFTTSGSFTVPDGVSMVYISGCGGGGGGGGGENGGLGSGGGGAGGGGAGAMMLKHPIVVVPGEVCTVTIGAAGAGGARQAPGTAGGATSFARPTGPTLAMAGGAGGSDGVVGITGSGVVAGGAGGAGGGAANGGAINSGVGGSIVIAGTSESTIVWANNGPGGGGGGSSGNSSGGTGGGAGGNGGTTTLGSVTGMPAGAGAAGGAGDASNDGGGGGGGGGGSTLWGTGGAGGGGGAHSGSTGAQGTVGSPGTGYGAGGGGTGSNAADATNWSSGQGTGGAGTAGILIVEW